jgi:two-component system sensor histidine kinase BaeS
MRLGITFKLFLAILATTLAVTLAMGAAVRWNFERHFVSYIKERESRRVDTIRDTLAELYRERGSWDDLRGNASLWNHVLTVPPHDLGGPGRPGPTSPAELLDALAGPPPLGDSAGFAGQAPRQEMMIAPPFTLLDSARRTVAGPPSPSSRTPRHPIRVDGMTVGWLVTPLPERLTDEADRRFQSEQREASWVIGLLSAALAAVVSILLARTFLAPVRRLAQATHKLSAGDYGTRVSVTSADELGQLGQDFNRLAHTLERNEALRREMVADISHELRTPLAVLQGELEALQDGVRTFTPSALASLQSEVGLLSKLIDDLYELALADVGALSYRMVPIDMSGIAARSVDSFRERFGTRGLQVVTDLAGTGTVMEGDPQRLTQLMNNLLQNALRYTDPGGTVSVAVRQENGMVVVDCQDSEPGVAPEHLPRLFDRLFRGDPSRSRDSGGAGLGLAICQRIVESHGGTIRALPSPLGGVRMHIAFPQAAAVSRFEPEPATS